MKNTRSIVLVALLTAAGAALAQDEPSPRGPVARPGWYVTPMAAYFMPDSARCEVDSGPGGALAFGHRGDFASLELWGQFLNVSKAACSYTVPDSGNPPPGGTNPEGDPDDDPDPVTEPEGDVTLNGAGLALVVGPFFENRVLQRFFGVIGFGVIRREDHPRYTQDDSTIFGDAGLGYLHPFELFGLETAARVDVRYRYDVQQPPHPEDQEPAVPHSYSDVVVHLGLQFALSPRPQPEPQARPETVAVVDVADADADGVPDDRDQCADTPLGVATDASGCVPAAPPPPAASIETAKIGDTIVLHGVNFETARATLTMNARTILDQVAEKLIARPALKIEIAGHTDDRGSDSYNQSLSEQRAQAVMAYLTERGVAAESLAAVGYGETQPVDSNETDEGRERNRRVELKLLEEGSAS